MSARKEYLGDGVYVAMDDDEVVLTTEDGLRATNTIVLEPKVIVALLRWLDSALADDEQGEAGEEQGEAHP